VDGSFCSRKDHPGDIDGYFVTDWPEWLSQSSQLASIDPAWNLNARRPDAHGKPKQLLWHKYKVELFPVFRRPFAALTSTGGSPPVTIDQFFRRSRDGHERGLIRVVSRGAPA
jgi:hypothetical protein